MMRALVGSVCPTIHHGICVVHHSYIQQQPRMGTETSTDGYHQGMPRRHSRMGKHSTYGWWSRHRPCGNILAPQHLISVLSVGIPDCDRRALFLPRCIQLCSHERTETRVFALHLCTWFKLTASRRLSTGTY